MVGSPDDVPGLDALIADQVGQNGRLFFRLAYSVLRDRAAAQDVCQQSLLKAWEWRGELRNAAKIRNWLARVVVNESLQLRRRGKIEQRIMAKQGASVGSAALGSTDAHSDVRDAVVTALEQLPEDIRVVVVMRIMEGLSGNEVKKILGCSATDVSRQLRVGLQRLRELLGDWQLDRDAGERDTNGM